jgi:hypothetical protein
VDPSILASSNQNVEYVVLVVDPTQIKAELVNNKKKKMYYMNCRFQDSWATKLPWVESIVGVDGKVTQVKCKVYIIIEG